MSSKNERATVLVRDALRKIGAEQSEGGSDRRRFDAVDPHQSLRDLGIDSIAAMELAAYFEDVLGTPVGQTPIEADATVADLVRFLEPLVP